MSSGSICASPSLADAPVSWSSATTAKITNVLTFIREGCIEFPTEFTQDLQYLIALILVILEETQPSKPPRYQKFARNPLPMAAIRWQCKKEEDTLQYCIIGKQTLHRLQYISFPPHLNELRSARTRESRGSTRADATSEKACFVKIRSLDTIIEPINSAVTV
ncbi:hypothetical protein PC117_g16912 [Phytophthora cactorum]|uniref:Uncharacterized protein n=1 Tax=Phytophthora cactorum TaxID=29920 RepID=A0A8T1C9H4_9STRA|nr:hypothetical protein PC117_g16912 [Phytophthora cactorum]